MSAKQAINEWHILVVEDEQDGREIAATLLSHFGITTDLASTAEQALDLLDQKQYTAAVIDLMLPGMDGLTLSRMMRGNAKTADLPSMAVTAHQSSTIKKQAFEAGYDGYYPKPLDYDGFIQELTRVCQLEK